jgi:5-methylcytosine-specific restriction endonuclease McrA
MRSKKTYKCPVCGVEFIDYETNPLKKFCSHACYHISMANGDYNYVFEKKRKNRFVCAYCGNSVIGKTKRKKRNGETADNIFCDIKCYQEFHKRKGKICICKHCEKQFMPRFNTKRTTNEYCSNECMRRHRLKDKVQICVICNQAFIPFSEKGSGRTIISLNVLTCSDRCKEEYRKTVNAERKDKISTAFTGEKHPNWIGGISFYRGENWRKQRRLARERDNYTCQMCGLTKSKIKRIFKRLPEVHHIIPYRKFGGDYEVANSLDNLITLCPSCHTKADWKYRKASHEN